MNCLLDYSAESMGLLNDFSWEDVSKGVLITESHEWKTKVTFCWSPTWWSNEIIGIIYEGLFMGPRMTEIEPHCQ